MSSSAPVCPVPLEQQPLEEYKSLRDSWFFRWATLGLWAYLKPLLVLWGVGWIFSSPVATVSFPASEQPLYFFLSAAAGAAVFPIFALIQLYLGWFYVRNRLADESIVYEESGWYDGQTWNKPAEVIQRDRLIVTYQIGPLLKRLRYTFLVLLVCFMGGVLTWSVAAHL